MAFKDCIILSAETYDRLMLVTQGHEELMLCVSAVALTHLYARFSELKSPCVALCTQSGRYRFVKQLDNLTVKAALYAFKERIQQQVEDSASGASTDLIVTSTAGCAANAPDSLCFTLENGAKHIVVECVAVSRRKNLLMAISGVLDFFLGRMLCELDSVLSSLPVINIPQTITSAREVRNKTIDFESELYDLCVTYAKKIALYDATRELTFQQLWDSVQQLKGTLKHRGVRPGDAIAIYCLRDIDPILLMLAALCVGACYVPLDPGYPLEVLQDYISESGISFIVVDDFAQPHVEKISKVHPILKLRELLESPIISVSNCGPNTIDRVAYVIFTSGSSGKRKAVGITISALLQSTRARVEYYGCDQGEVRNILIASISFDSSVGVIYGSLFSGEALFIPVAGSERDVNLILDTIEANAVTSLLTLPSYIKLLLEADQSSSRSKGLRRIICAGEVLEKTLVNALYHQRNELTIFNEYGPTEGTVWATVNRIIAEKPEPDISIGCAHSNNSVYVLDENLNLVPPEIEGELYIAGGTLAIGYLNDVSETASRFLPNPFSASGERLYRTGDRFSRTAAGALHYHGRLDRQLKISGYRVSLTELEEQAVSITGVQEAAAVIVEKDTGSIKLFIRADISVAEALDQLKAKVPTHAIPSSVTLIENFPRLPNGKNDYQKLAEIAVAEALRSNKNNEGHPIESLETYLFTLWQSILKVEITEPSVDFFELGGSSIKAIMLLNRIQKKIDRTLYVGAAFEQPTIIGMANYLKSNFSEALIDANIKF
ncbi:non-ribosomal peptide synthetase [Pseudomonas sp. MYb193]|nr:non-ribosomal peptide synthetase [Pseudomonas sp. MYb193]AVJ24097.1 hypothetical protein CLM72_21155 [Pseudomonas sp. MYb193]